MAREKVDIPESILELMKVDLPGVHAQFVEKGSQRRGWISGLVTTKTASRLKQQCTVWLEQASTAADEAKIKHLVERLEELPHV